MPNANPRQWGNTNMALSAVIGSWRVALYQAAELYDDDNPLVDPIDAFMAGAEWERQRALDVAATGGNAG